jgi:diguanylate cyclase (GGDEF)-like protein/PAS domain S-box-containing protein
MSSGTEPGPGTDPGSDPGPAPIPEGRYRAIVEAQAELISLARPDGTLVYVNPSYARQVGTTPQALIGRSLFEQVPELDREAVRQLIDRVIETGQPVASENRMLAADGQSRLISWTNGVQVEDGQTLLHSVGRDVTVRRRLEQEVRDGANVLRLVADAIPATVVVVSAERRYRFVNRAFEDLVGLPREQIIDRTPAEILGPDEALRRQPWIARALAGEAVTFELDHDGPDGTRWSRLSCIPLRLAGGEVDGFVGVSQDITQQRREQDRLTELSQRDALTGALNRSGFELAVERHIRSGHGATLGLLYIDLDRFKPVNDRHGHPVGDRLLEQVAQRLSQLVRPVDAVARLGGDEFAILLVELTRLAHAEAVAAKVVHALAQPFEVDGLSLAIGASVGVALGADAAGGVPDLIRRADAQLYRAKAEGRGRHAS